MHHRQPEREKRRKRGACIDPKGYDAGKKISGKKRHVLVDTEGLLMHAVVHTADVQDRDGGLLVMATLFGLYPFLKKLFADGGYQGAKFRQGLAKVLPHLGVEIVKRSDIAEGFEVLPRRWVVERALAWLNRCRRLAKDFENLSRNALAFIKLASIRLAGNRVPITWPARQPSESATSPARRTVPRRWPPAENPARRWQCRRRDTGSTAQTTRSESTAPPP